MATYIFLSVITRRLATVPQQTGFNFSPWKIRIFINELYLKWSKRSFTKNVYDRKQEEGGKREATQKNYSIRETSRLELL